MKRKTIVVTIIIIIIIVIVRIKIIILIISPDLRDDDLEDGQPDADEEDGA